MPAVAQLLIGLLLPDRSKVKYLIKRSIDSLNWDLDDELALHLLQNKYCYKIPIERRDA